jgi:mevalonate kinase
MRVNGKFILTGEHSVLRGGPALVFPLRSRYLDVLFQPGTEALQFKAEGPVGVSELNLVFWSLLERGLKILKLSREEVAGKLAGTLTIRNNIPLGSGLGASAALCVGIGRWFVSLGLLDNANLFSFSRQLEDLFHGESSGVDIAVAIESRELIYKRNLEPQPLKNFLKPKLYLSFCGISGKTSDCVSKVKALIERDQATGAQIDSDMIRASEMAIKALAMEGEEGLNLLTDSMNKARSCFERWGLAEGQLSEQMLRLLETGARAVKPTGSGGGGYILSLWDHTPKNPDLIEC